MNEYMTMWQAFGGLVGLILASLMYSWGGRSGKWRRRYVASFILAITVKLARLVELCDKAAKNESIEDTLKDLANYACLLSLYIKECHDMGSISVCVSGETHSTSGTGYFKSNQ